MPIMDGFEASKRISEMMDDGMIKKCPIIANSAFPESTYGEKCIEARMVHFLAKPNSINQVKIIVEKFF
jgi:CheY-like chemotaxis protein